MQKNPSLLENLLLYYVKSFQIYRKMPSLGTFRDGIKQFLKIAQGDLTEACPAVYINHLVGIGIRSSLHIHSGKCCGDTVLSPTAFGQNQNQFSEGAIQINRASRCKTVAAPQIHLQLTEA